VDLPIKARIYIYCLCLLALVAIGYYSRDLAAVSVEQIISLVLFIVLGFLSEVYATWLPVYGFEISSSVAIYLASLFILGPSLTVFIVLFATLASEALMRWDHLKHSPNTFVRAVSFNVAQWVVTVSVTGLMLILTQHVPVTLTSAKDFLWAFVAFLCYAGINLSLVTGIISLTKQKSFFYSLITVFKDFAVQYISLFAAALLLVVLYSLSIWHMLLAIVPLILVHVSFRSHLRLQTEARKTFEKISRLLDERDHYTAVHSTEVADLAVKIAQEMGFSQKVIEKVDIAARVHDIGKIAVPDSILLKPGPLSAEEWVTMKRHPVISAELIEGLEIYKPVANAVRHEHEHWNGSGYPDGLKGDQIPLIARVITAADIHNALSTDRPYRKAFSHEKTIEMIKDMRGTDLDPTIADALLRVIALPGDEPSSVASLPRDESVLLK
jgi:HD-GYP domain-containing protein (c-di-GMP phosphodiesterase class II)